MLIPSESLYRTTELVGTYERQKTLPLFDDRTTCHELEYAVSFSRGIRNLRNINKFLNVAGVISPLQAINRQVKVKCVVVWGRKKNSQRALRYATRKQLPVRFVEDGWIRSSSDNPHSRVCYSILTDDIGVYYDSTEPSALERLLNRTDDKFNADCGPEDLQYAAACRKKLIDNNITKYNSCTLPEPADLEGKGKPLILVIDQTVGDASVTFGGMSAQLFHDMLDRAIVENPNARIVVRTHPDVVMGIKQGYLQSRANELGIEISAAGDNPLPWLKHARAVYVGTSQLGYEALLCGCLVKVAGKPFYAGWGLTEDEQTIDRRIQTRTIDQMFHTTHVEYARYCSPISGKPWSLEECLDHVILQLGYFSQNKGKKICVGITPWKKRYLKQFLRSPYASLRFSPSNNAADDERTFVWSFSEANVKKLSTRLASVKSDQHSDASDENTVRIEDGFIRSTGLGSDFTPPASLVFDNVGLYFDATRPSRLENLLNDYQCSEEELIRARRLKNSILTENMTKYNVNSHSRVTLFTANETEGKKRVLVVGQVEGDQSLIKGSLQIQTNADLLKAVRVSNPSAYIVYKPHPDVVSGNRHGIVDAETLDKNVDRIETFGHFLDCLDECDELHTMTSLSGFEAILRDKTVVTYGMPFYAGWGLTRDLCKCKRRKRLRTVDELVFLCLVMYPHYIDLKSGEFISVEQLVEMLSNEKRQINMGKNGSWSKKIANIASALTYQT